MEYIKLADSELKFMNLIWEVAPINSTELVKLAEERLGWKKSTIYTVVRRLTKKQILKSEKAIVSYLIEKEAIQQLKGEEVLGKIYEGSIGVFLSAFLSKTKITQKEADELKEMIDEHINKEE